MAGVAADAPPAGLPSGPGLRLARQARAFAMRRWPLAPAIALCLAAAVAGIALPAARPSPAAVAAVADALGPVPAKAASEDLSAFLASRRWGISLADAYPAASAPTAGINPALAELGFVGVTALGGSFAALVLMDGAVVRLTAGDTLPDGQTLAAVDGNTVAIQEPGGGERVLVLFPPAATP